MYKTIEDKKGNQLKYRLNLSENPIGSPLFIVLHGYGSFSTKFQYEGWNILAPYDNFGYNNKGSWWLGEDGDFFVKELLQKLIKEVSIKYKCENNIYFYGSSMGGYGAILHGILSNARAVYSNVPQIKFSSHYFSFFNNQVESIFGVNKGLLKEYNLINYLNNKDTFPVFFLCENMIEEINHLEGYLKENTLLFANKCYDYQLKLHLELLPYSGHTKNLGLKEVLDKFKRYVPPIKDTLLLVNKNFKLNSNNWFLNRSKLIETIKFGNNSFELDSIKLKSNDIIYLSSGGSNLKNMDNREEEYSILGCKTFDFTIEIKKADNLEISFFLMEFSSNSNKVSGKSYPLNYGVNHISHSLNQNSKYLKMAFRFCIIKDGIFSLIVRKFDVKFLK